MNYKQLKEWQKDKLRNSKRWIDQKNSKHSKPSAPGLPPGRIMDAPFGSPFGGSIRDFIWGRSVGAIDRIN